MKSHTIWASLLLLVLFSFCLQSSFVWARYPRITRDAQGTWIASDDCLIRVVGELFTFYGASDNLPSDRIRMLAADTREVWVATPRGLGRMDRNSRRWESLHAPQPLPDDNVYTVATDDRYVWVGTQQGAVRWDKLNKDWSLLDQPQGPADAAVFDILALGNLVWFASAKGLYRFDRQRGQWRSFGRAEGLDVGQVRELIQMGDSLWMLAEDGLARLDLRSQAIHTFTKADGLPSSLVTAFAPVAGEIWIGTDLGLVVYQAGSDSISPFIYQKGMPAGGIVGIEASLPWVWVATEQGLGIFNTMTGVWEAKREEDGLAPDPIQGLALAGAMLVLLQNNGVQGYQFQRDDWLTFSREDIWSKRVGSGGQASDLRFNFELIASGEGKIIPTSDGVEHNEQIVPDIRLGVGSVLKKQRTLDASVRIDFGDATTSGVREYDAELRFRGNETDTLKELVVSDELRLRDNEEQNDLEDDTWLEGIGIYQRLGKTNGSKREPISIEAEAGLRRGVRTREFFRGSIDFSYQLAHQYVSPKSEVVKVDGMILDRDVDYIITHTTGQLTFLNPDRVNALSLIDITYTYEQIPRKDTASRSILEMLPWDNELGGFVRSGSPVYVSDEGGLYAQINGAAPKYLDRGWMESVFQDYVQGSTSLSVQIHDMGALENAQEIFDYDRPISYVVLWEEADTTALLDESLPSSYAVKMRMDRYYVELSIDEKSKSAEILIRLFAQAIRTKGDLSGTLLDSLRPLVGRVRVGVNPSDNVGLGVGYMGSSDLEDAQVMDRMGIGPGSFELLTLDLWSQHSLGSGSWAGDLSSFFQVGRSLSQGGSQPSNVGQAASGDIVYNSAALNLRLDGTWNSKEFEAGAARNTPLGQMAGNIRADATLSPWRWMRLRILYDHERSYLDPSLVQSNERIGVVENLIGKLTLMRAGWPTVWLLAGCSVLSAADHRDEKMRLASSLEYDLAHGLLSSLNLKKLAIKAYFDHSENQLPILIDQHNPVLDPLGQKRWLMLGSSPGTAQNMRFELKFAPTSTEDAYARFERKTFEPDQAVLANSADEQTIGLPLEAWELIMGAASRILPGVVPTFNGKLTYREGRDSSSGDYQNAQAILAGQIEMFPGRWVDALGSTMLSVGYGYTNGEESEGDRINSDEVIWAKKVHLRKEQIEAKAIYGNYDDFFRIESRGKWWKIHEGEVQIETERYLELFNRLIFRPIYTSPITLRLDFAQLDQLAPDEQTMGTVSVFRPSLEWEKRWSHDLVTKVRLEVPWRVLDNAWDETREITQSHQEWSLKPWIEVRLRLREFLGDSMLRLALRGYMMWVRPFDTGQGNSGAQTAREFYTSFWLDWDRAGMFLIRLGAIYLWNVCENLDLDDPVVVSAECRSQHSIQPSVKAIIRF